MPKKTKTTVLCRMSVAERNLIEAACAKRQAQTPDAVFGVNKTMVRVALNWARAVLAEK